MMLSRAFAFGVFAVAVVATQTSRGDEPKGTSTSAPNHATAADLDDVEHMCALLTGCDRLPLPANLVARDFGGCVKSMYDELASANAVQFSLTLRDCGLRASSCGELRTCALRGARADVCAGRGKQGPMDVCDEGGRAITCDHERVALVRDCPRGGEQCVIKGGHAQCALGSCEKETAPSCSPSNTRILECKNGKLGSLDCAAFGLRCVATSDGPKCATQGPSCAVEKAQRCDGNVAVVCKNGHETRIDCGSSLTCASTGVSSDRSVGVCAATATTGASDAGVGACDASAAPRCDGASIKWCAWGKPRSYLCKSMGLSRCVTDERGAHCAS